MNTPFCLTLSKNLGTLTSVWVKPLSGVTLTSHDPVSLLLRCISLRSLNGRRGISSPYRLISALQEMPPPQSTPYETLRLELAIASLDWFLTPIPKSHKRFARQNCFRPPTGFRPPSPCSGIDRLASSLTAMTQRTFTRFSSHQKMLRELGFPSPPP